MIYNTNHLFCTIKTGKVKINSISKSIKNITLKEKSWFVLFNLDCTPSIKHICFCLDSITKKQEFTAIDFLIKLTGETQVKSMEEKTELNKTKNACIIVIGKNKEKTAKSMKQLTELTGLKETKLISSEKRLKKLIKKEKISKKTLNAFGEDFYSALDNFFIEKSALVIK